MNNLHTINKDEFIHVYLQPSYNLNYFLVEKQRKYENRLLLLLNIEHTHRYTHMMKKENPPHAHWRHLSYNNIETYINHN